MTLGHVVCLTLSLGVGLCCNPFTVEQIVRIFGVNRANCDTSTKVAMRYFYGYQIQSNIQDGGHFPRWPRTNKCYFMKLDLIDDFRGACAFKGNGAVAGHVKRVDHDDVFDALLFREETLTRHYFKLKFDFSWGIRTNMGKTDGIFLNLQCNCHIVGSIIRKLIIHRTISVHGCQI